MSLKLKNLLSFFIASLLTANIAFAHIHVGKSAPDFSLESATTGKEVKLSDFIGKIVVLEWSNYECPFVRKHYNSQNMQNLQKKYIAKDVVWLTIMSSAPGKQGYYEKDELLAKAKAKGSNPTHILRDPQGIAGKLYDAKTTPNMFVIDKVGKLAYSGAIDSINSANIDDINKADNYVVLAVDALLQGKKITTPITYPYGCTVKY